MYCVSIEKKHEWKFGRIRNAVGTRATGKCFHSFFEFSQTSLSLVQTSENIFSISLRNYYEKKEENNLLTLIIKILFAHAIIMSTARASSVFLLSYRNKIFNQSACVFPLDCFLINV